MSKKQSCAVFGLGRYGLSVAGELAANGMDVIAVDHNPDLVNAAGSEIPYCKCADVTDADTLRQLGIEHVDVVVIAMASHLEASVMATMLCRELGVSEIIVKCANETHCKILSRVGASRVVLPEIESGVRLAKNLLSSGFVDIIELSQAVSMVEMEVRPEWEGKSLLELNLRKKYAVNVVAIVQNKNVTVNIDPEKPLQSSMKLIVIANRDRLKKLH